MGHKEKNLLIGGLIAIIVIMGVGYAAFTTVLNINGTATISSNWDVHIDSIKVSTDPNATTGADVPTPQVTENNLTATFSSTLQAPGDYVTYDVKVVNEGSLKAKLTGIDFTQTNNGTGTTADTGDKVEGNTGSGYEGDNAIIYSYEGININDTLEAETGEITFHVTVKYNDNIQKQPDAKELQSKLKMVLTYEQDKGE